MGDNEVIDLCMACYDVADETTAKINSIKLELISAFHKMSLNGIEFNYRSVWVVVERIVK